MSRDPVTGDRSEVLKEAIPNLFDIVEGDGEIDDSTYEDAMEPGLNSYQHAVAERYAGDGWIEVDSSRVPTLADKLAEGKELPWTFVLDGVEFVKKTSIGSACDYAQSEWWWIEDGYRFTFLRHSDRKDRVSIVGVDDD